MWVLIVKLLLAFTFGILMARETGLPILALCLVYFIVTTLVYIVGLYVFGATL